MAQTSRPFKRRRLSGEIPITSPATASPGANGIDPRRYASHHSAQSRQRRTVNQDNSLSGDDSGQSNDVDWAEEDGEEDKEQDDGQDNMDEDWDEDDEGDEDVDQGDESEVDEQRMKEDSHVRIESADKASIEAFSSKKPSTRATKATQQPAFNLSTGPTSDLFKIQCDQLLKRVAIDETSGSSPHEVLFKLKEIIEGLPASKQLHKPDLELELRKIAVAVPFPDPLPSADSQLKFGFSPPSSINVVGSHVLKTYANISDLHLIDLVVEMPRSLFTEKDYLNYRYFHKRAAYLAHIAAGLNAAKGTLFKIRYNTLNGDDLFPVVLVEPQDKDSKSEFARSKQTIRIMPTISDGIFPRTRLLPSVNAIRAAKQVDGDHNNVTNEPTPRYNSALRSDCSVMQYHKFLHSTSSRVPGFRHACLLGRIWLRQRGFASRPSAGGFGNFEWSVVTALLLTGGSSNGRPVLAETYSAHQLFRGTLQFLASRDLVKQPIFIGGATVDVPKSTRMPYFYDCNAQLNVLFRMTGFSHRTLRKEATVSSRSLGNRMADAFQACFIQKTNELFLAYDVGFQLEVPRSSMEKGSPDSVDPVVDLATRLHSHLQRGLGDRVKSIQMHWDARPPWDVSRSMSKSKKSSTTVQVMINIDSNNASRLVDRGPEPELQTESEEFRAFWKDKAELRRFKDGSIQESVVWNGTSALDITEHIVAFITSTHFGIDGSKHLKFLRPQRSSISRSLLDSNAASAFFDMHETAFRKMENDIRALDNFPLQVRHIAPADPLLSRTAQSVSNELGGYVATADVVIQFEASAKWPDNLVAIQATKIAFLLKLGELLQKQDEELITRVGIENDRSPQSNRSFLELVYPVDENAARACFHLRIHHDREQTLLKKLLDQPDKKTLAAGALASYKRTFINSGLHTQAIKIFSTRFPAYSASARLCKTWFAAHQLSPFFPPQLIELFVARSFLHPEPWQTPQSSIPAFLRTLLFLSLWDWEDTPLLVDFSGSMTAPERDAVDTQFKAWRTIDPLMTRLTLFAATNFDTSGSTWTEHIGPPRVVASRMRVLAIAAIDVVQSQGLGLDLDQLFHSPLRHYNFLIHLNKQFSASKTRQLSRGQKFKNLQVAAADPQIIGYQPVKAFLDELQHAFGDAALFFWDERDGPVIAGLWSPQIERRRFKVGLPWSTIPVQREQAVNGHVNGNGVNGDRGGVDADAVANKSGMLAEMARLGGDLVSSVTLQ